ncbi:MAG: PEP/pyruvate-binding domain-containing protein, partial [Chloroflexota bacterium]
FGKLNNVLWFHFLALLINCFLLVDQVARCVPSLCFMMDDLLVQNSLMSKIENSYSEIRNEEDIKKQSKHLKNLILSGDISKSTALEIASYLKKQNTQYVSIRSSAELEGSYKASFAGMFDTYLNIESDIDSVLDLTKKCWASVFNENTLVYQFRMGVMSLVGIAVIIQEMIPSEISGVVRTVHPLDSSSLVIEMSYGIGDIIVKGLVQPDTYVVERNTLRILEKIISNKNIMSICKGTGLEIIEVHNELAKKQAITDKVIRDVARTCLMVEKVFGYPQNIEVCIFNDKIWLLQSRPVVGGKNEDKNYSI